VILTAEQQWLVATVYEKAAADVVGVPSPQRAAFARKAKRFRLLARLAAKIKATAAVKRPSTQDPHQANGVPRPSTPHYEWRPKAKCPTLAERLEAARAARASDAAEKDTRLDLFGRGVSP